MLEAQDGLEEDVLVMAALTGFRQAGNSALKLLFGQPEIQRYS